jgi:AraC family transcriptional regulator
MQRLGSLIQVSPIDFMKRRTAGWHGVQIELMQFTGSERVELRFRASFPMLVAHERGTRRIGETSLEGVPRSARRDLAKKLTLVPAGHEYHEWHEPRSPMHILLFHFDPDTLNDFAGSDSFATTPRLFFEDAALWATVAKLKEQLEIPSPGNSPYMEALGAVLRHELARLDSRSDRVDPPIRGGLAAWQQRAVTTYIEERLSEQIPLTTLAQLARLSPYHFCRAFKQSFGIPPHRYHTKLRIERAKALLETREQLSITKIALALGFSETSSFTAAFRRETGLTPTGYHRQAA